MKFTLAALAAPALALLHPVRGAHSAMTGDRTITQVVKLLQTMMGKSKEESDEERTLWGKTKCFCDTTETDKTAEIGGLTKTIRVLESNIDELLASTSVLSKEVAKLKSDKESNEAARASAEAIRAKELEAYTALKADLEGAVSQMNLALETLSAIGADQTLSSGADHAKFMASYKPATLVSLREKVQQALVAASAFVEKKQLKAVESLLQAPFTGTYTAQAGEVVGILKGMRDTFEDNLAAATTQERVAKEAHDKWLANALAEWKTMDEAFNAKQGQLASNDDDLSAKRTSLTASSTQKEQAETFLQETRVDCAAKSKNYDKRVSLRQNEEAAIAEAISILNSDAAFTTFGSVDATSTGAAKEFLQLAAIHEHSQASTDHEARRSKARELLWKAAARRPTLVPLARVAALLEADNPFSVVLTDIDKLVTLISKEEKNDDTKLAWCSTERDVGAAGIKEKGDQIDELKSQIDSITDAMENPVTGLKALIAGNEDSLSKNLDSQASLTKARSAATAVYQADVQNLVEAEALLSKAIAALTKFYSQLISSEGALLQKQKKQPLEPYKGQSEHGGNDAVSMLEFILDNTKKEEEQAHSDEAASQHAYEDAVTTLKSEQESLLASIAEQKVALAQKETELLGKQEDHKATSADKAAIESYVLSIKPGCDFITLNIEGRKADRKTETEALEKAKALLIDSPVYKVAVAAAHDESLGECLPTCQGKEEHAECKACLAKVTVPGYCAGHPGTEGC